MTRINLVAPEELTDQHLMAEWREIKMVPAALRRSLRTREQNDILRGIPKQFTLNRGHVSFFYDKIGYLKRRYGALTVELVSRGYKLSSTDPDVIFQVPEVFVGMWEPDARALGIIRERIATKIAMKPEWYRYRGNKLT